MFSFDQVHVAFDSQVYEFTGLPPTPRPSFCHGDAELAAALAALRPRGDAWRHGGFDALEGSIMGGFFQAMGAAFGPTDRRFCVLVDEFFCSTAVETRDLWALEYGLPDGCDPFADLCEKVNAVGDGVPAYAEAAALRRGWSVAIGEDFITLVQSCRMGRGRMGTLRMGAAEGVAWRIVVDLDNSPAFISGGQRKPLMGRMRMAYALDCGPDLSPLACLIRRIAPAHADLVFSTKP